MATSEEFIDLCRGQIALLNEAMGASWSAVYVTQQIAENNQPAQLIQVAAYPQKQELRPENNRLEILPKVWHRWQKTPSLPSTEELKNSGKKNAVNFTSSKSYLVKQRQLVLPLVYQDRVVGLLVTRRSDREWNEQEYDLIEKIAATIAIGCKLARERDWYREELQQQQQVAKIERNQLEDLLHQLRNPISALRTFSKLLLKRFINEDPNRKIATSMLRESDRLQELIATFQQNTDSLALNIAPNLPSLPSKSPLISPTKNLQVVPTEIEQVLNPLLISTEAIANERKIEFTSYIKANLPLLAADREALREVLSNLIDNALKYTPEGGKVEIEAGLSRHKNDLDWLGIAVKNTGTEIPSQDRLRIFERHYRGVQARGEIQGTGLGLAIAKEFVEAMEGEIELIVSEASDRREQSNWQNIFIIWLKQVDT